MRDLDALAGRDFRFALTGAFVAAMVLDKQRLGGEF
jgi:hypothetical protein